MAGKQSWMSCYHSSGNYPHSLAGDSGGPLVNRRADGLWVQFGIASYINEDAGCGSIVPAVWTRVSVYYDFIMQTAADNAICTV